MSTMPQPEVPTGPVRGFSRGAKRAIIAGVAGLGVVVVAVLVVVSVVIIPNQKAMQRAETDHQAAVAQFRELSDQCPTVTTEFNDAMQAATDVASTDRTALAEPTLMDDLAGAISAAKKLSLCSVPTTATETPEILEQVTTLQNSLIAMRDAAGRLNDLVDAITESKDELAEAKAKAASSGSFNLKDTDGYTWRVTLTGLTVDVTYDDARGKPGNAVVEALFGEGEILFRNTTEGKIAPGDRAEVTLIPLYAVNPCVLGKEDAAYGSQCRSVTLNRKKYFSAGTWLYNSTTVGELGVGGETSKPIARGVVSSWELQAGPGKKMADVLRSPVGWVLTESAGSDCKNIVLWSGWESCLVGTTDSLKS